MKAAVHVEHWLAGWRSRWCTTAGSDIVMAGGRNMVVPMRVNAVRFMRIVRHQMQEKSLLGIHCVSMERRRRCDAKPGDERGHQHGESHTISTHAADITHPRLYSP